MEFQKLVDSVACPPDIRIYINRLLEDKLAGREMDEGPRIEAFHRFFDDEIKRVGSIVGNIPSGNPSDYELFNKLFRSMVGKYIGQR
jgi:hypothetical protein